MHTSLKLGNLELITRSLDERLALEDLISYSDSIETTKLTVFETTKYEVTAKKEEVIKTFYIYVTKNNTIKSVLKEDDTIILSNSNVGNLLNEIVDQLYMECDKQLKDILKVIQCEDNKCPICGTEMQVNRTARYISGTDSLFCENKCYFIQTRKGKNLKLIAKIFGEKTSNFRYGSNVKQRIQRINQIYNKINELKKDDNYLIKIITQNN